MQISLNSITYIKLCPINRLWLIDDVPLSGWTIEDAPSGSVACNALQINFSESESSINIEPITTKTGSGGARMVAAQLTASFVFPHTDIRMMDARLSPYIGKPVSAVIQLGDERYRDADGYTNYFLYLTKLTEGSEEIDARVEVNYSHNTVDQRIRTTVNFTSMIFKPKKHFTNNVTWWWP